MERESFVDFLQLIATFVVGALALRCSLWLLGWDAFVKDAGFYFVNVMAGACVIWLGLDLLKMPAGGWLKAYFALMFVAAVAVNVYKFCTGTLTPVIP